MKKFIDWFYRVNNWFLKPSLLSLAISSWVPVFFAGFIRFAAVEFPEYFSMFWNMSAGSERFPYETWIICFWVAICGLCWSIIHWLFDLIKYFRLKFCKSSAPADDK